MFNANIKRKPNPDPNLNPHPTLTPKPNYYPHSNSSLSEISQEQLSPKQISDHHPFVYYLKVLLSKSNETYLQYTL